MPGGDLIADEAATTGPSRAGWSIGLRLTQVALVVALPFLMLSAGVTYQLVDFERSTRRDGMLLTARALLNVVDEHLRRQAAVALALSTSPALLAGDLETFRVEAERVQPTLSGGFVIVADGDGQQLLNLSMTPGQPLPRRRAEGIEGQQKAIETGSPQISNVFLAPTSQVQVVAVDVPVRRPGLPTMGLAVVTDVRALLPLIQAAQLPDGWFAGLVDRSGNIIARTRDHDGTVGRPASEAFRAATKRAHEGWADMTSLSGSTTATAHTTSEFSGWTIGVAADKAMFEAPIERTIFTAALAGGLATLLSVLLALWAARQITTPLRQVEDGAHALLLRKPVSFSTTGLTEIDRALDAFSETAKALEEHERERDERESHVHLLMRELSHRSKNLLAIVLAIARQTARQSNDFKDFEGRFAARIQALADAHDLLVEQQWVGAPLEALVHAQLLAFGTERVTLIGPPVMLKAEAVQNVGLALHELATNASKYGALSAPEGRVTIEWSPQGDAPGQSTLNLVWRETGGPAVTPPTRKGFGRMVLERVTLEALGRGTLEFPPTGLVWTCEIDPEHLVGTPAVPTDSPKRRAADQTLRRAS